MWNTALPQPNALQAAEDVVCPECLAGVGTACPHIAARLARAVVLRREAFAHQPAWRSWLRLTAAVTYPGIPWDVRASDTLLAVGAVAGQTARGAPSPVRTMLAQRLGNLVGKGIVQHYLTVEEASALLEQATQEVPMALLDACHALTALEHTAQNCPRA
jgi:hypothetical protein